MGGGTHCYLLERLLSGVRADVVVERCGAGEGPATVSTLERTVAGVGHHVVPQLGRLGEGLGAVATLVRPEDTESHRCTQMYIKHGCCWKARP